MLLVLLVETLLLWHCSGGEGGVGGRGRGGGTKQPWAGSSLQSPMSHLLPLSRPPPIHSSALSWPQESSTYTSHRSSTPSFLPIYDPLFHQCSSMHLIPTRRIVQTDFFYKIYLKTNSWLIWSERLRRVGFGRQTFPSHFSSFHEGSPASSSKLSRKAATCWFFININLFDHCLHWSHVAHIIIHRHMEQGSLKTTLNWMLYNDKMFLLHSIVIPLLSPLPLSIIHTGWWRRGLETTTTLTPVAPSSLCDAKTPHNYQ